MKGKSESEVAQSCLTLPNPIDCSLPGSSIHEIFLARVLEWVAIAFSNESIENQIIPFIHICDLFLLLPVLGCLKVLSHLMSSV